MSGYGREGEWILCTPGAESQEDIGVNALRQRDEIGRERRRKVRWKWEHQERLNLL
jgi:hypothetical protein